VTGRKKRVFLTGPIDYLLGPQQLINMANIVKSEERTAKKCRGGALIKRLLKHSGMSKVVAKTAQTVESTSYMLRQHRQRI
jgi:hypothetical protein